MLPLAILLAVAVPMHSHVSPLGQDLQVRRVVVRLVAVPVMHTLMPRQRAPQHPLGDDAMLVPAVAVDRDAHVSVRRQAAHDGPPKESPRALIEPPAGEGRWRPGAMAVMDTGSSIASSVALRALPVNPFMNKED